MFYSRRNGEPDLYEARRASKSDPFGTPVPVAELNSAQDESHPRLTPDGLKVYFGSTRPEYPGDPDQNRKHPHFFPSLDSSGRSGRIPVWLSSMTNFFSICGRTSDRVSRYKRRLVTSFAF